MGSDRRQNAGAVVAGLLMLGAAGCGPGLYPVRGTVTYPDGKPVTAGTVVFESRDQSKPVTARGEIQADGSYELGTHRPGDGAPAGRYRVLVAPPYDPNAADRRDSPPPPFDQRFSEFGTSGLEFEVTPAGPNVFPFQVKKAGR